MVVAYRRICPPSPARAQVHSPDQARGPHQEAHTNQKTKNTIESVVTGAGRCKSSHSSGSLDTVFVRRNGLKQLNATENLNPLLDLFLKDALTVQYRLQHTICYAGRPV